MKFKIFKLFILGTLNLIHLQAYSHDLQSVEQAALKIGCQVALASDTGNDLVCFRNDVMDLGKDTETSGCAVRLYDLRFEDFKNLGNSEDNVLLVPTACEDGGLESVLNWSVDEDQSLKSYLLLAFSREKKVFSVNFIEAKAITEFVVDINIKIAAQSSRLQIPAGAPPVPAAAPHLPGERAVPPQESARLSKHATVQVFYGSDRQFVPRAPPSEAYSNERNKQSQLSLGTVDVSIPANHKLGELEVPDLYSIQMTPDPDRYIVVKSINRLNTNGFWQVLSERVQKSNKKDLFVFVHGFNVSFEEAAQRTAQMAYDLKFAGAPVFYSWPSETILRYAIAEKNVEWTLPRLIEFLQNLKNKSGAAEIHLIAHSMGNRALTNALNALSLQRQDKTKPIFKNVILAAPDVDQKTFRAIESSVRSSTESLTLYASNRDKALEISARIHKGPRLGQAGEFTLVSPGMDTIDASSVDVSFLGHSYYGDNPSVIIDLAKIIMDALPVIKRPLLEQRLTPTGQSYWHLFRK